MAEDLRIAILGTGHMAQTFAFALGSVPGVALAGFASRDPARAASLSNAFGASGRYVGLGDILADQTVAALYIANDTASHASAAIAALDAGKAVLCEKPCALDAEEARAIAQAAERTGKLFMEAIPTPFLPAVTQVLAAARSSELGTLRRFTAEFGYPTTAQSHPACYAPLGGGVLLDRSIYLVTLALMAMGPASEVEARVHRNADGIDVEAWITLVHADGATSSLGASLISELDNRLHIAGTSGSAAVEAPLLAAERFSITTFGTIERPAPSRAGLATRLKQSGALRRGVAIGRAARMAHLSYGDSLYRGEIEHFRDLLRTGTTVSPVLPPSLSVAALTILDKGRTCAG